MRKLRTAVLAGIATLGVAGTAMAASNDTHVMAVGLPDGSVARNGMLPLIYFHLASIQLVRDIFDRQVRLGSSSTLDLTQEVA